MYTKIILSSTESTNQDAITLANKGAEHGTAVIATTQTQGRGRLGKLWQSPPGTGLYCSIIVRPHLSLHDFPRITFVAGLAVAESIQKTCGLVAGLKWPNDIYFNMRKCGGILTESSNLNTLDNERYAVVGIGLNINTNVDDFNSDLRATATSLYIESGHELDVDLIFEDIRKELLKELEEFERDGFTPIITRWRKRDFMLGKELAWVSITGKVIVGVSLGADDDGKLHVRDGNGEVHEILSGDIQLAS